MLVCFESERKVLPLSLPLNLFSNKLYKAKTAMLYKTCDQLSQASSLFRRNSPLPSYREPKFSWFDSEPYIGPWCFTEGLSPPAQLPPSDILWNTLHALDQVQEVYIVSIPDTSIPLATPTLLLHHLITSRTPKAVEFQLLLLPFSLHGRSWLLKACDPSMIDPWSLVVKVSSCRIGTSRSGVCRHL